MAHAPVARRFTPLQTLEQFDELLRESQTHPVVIFKHSPTCGTSAMAHDALSDLLEGDGPQVHLVDVLSARPVSQAIATRLGVRHESPQVLVLADGAVRWHGSHYRVTADAVRRAVAA